MGRVQGVDILGFCCCAFRTYPLADRSRTWIVRCNHRWCGLSLDIRICRGQSAWPDRALSNLDYLADRDRRGGLDRATSANDSVIDAPSTGQKLAILACVLMLIDHAPLELGSPVPPYMDVLKLPASAQRILTFGKYLPFDNDPYGYWSPIAQSPGLELVLRVPGFRQLYERSRHWPRWPRSTPMVAYHLGAYRLGRSLMNDVAGGIAALLLFATTIFVRAHSMRGTAVAFALITIGLAFLLDQNRRPIQDRARCLGPWNRDRYSCDCRRARVRHRGSCTTYRIAWRASGTTFSPKPVACSALFWWQCPSLRSR